MSGTAYKAQNCGLLQRKLAYILEGMSNKIVVYNMQRVGRVTSHLTLSKTKGFPGHRTFKKKTNKPEQLQANWTVGYPRKRLSYFKGDGLIFGQQK